MTRLPLMTLEKFLIGAVAAQLVFSITAWAITGDPAHIHIKEIGLLGLGILFAIGTIWLILRRHALGLGGCVFVHAIQVLQWAFESGDEFRLRFFVSVAIQLNGDDLHPVRLNLLALVLFVLSMVALEKRLDANLAARSPPPEPTT